MEFSPLEVTSRSLCSKKLLLEITAGNYLWKLSIEIKVGNYLWKLLLEITLGSYFWKLRITIENPVEITFETTIGNSFLEGE